MVKNNRFIVVFLFLITVPIRIFSAAQAKHKGTLNDNRADLSSKLAFIENLLNTHFPHELSLVVIHYLFPHWKRYPQLMKSLKESHVIFPKLFDESKGRLMYHSGQDYCDKMYDCITGTTVSLPPKSNWYQDSCTHAAYWQVGRGKRLLRIGYFASDYKYRYVDAGVDRAHFEREFDIKVDEEFVRSRTQAIQAQAEFKDRGGARFCLLPNVEDVCIEFSPEKIYLTNLKSGRCIDSFSCQSKSDFFRLFSIASLDAHTARFFFIAPEEHLKVLDLDTSKITPEKVAEGYHRHVDQIPQEGKISELALLNGGRFLAMRKAAEVVVLNTRSLKVSQTMVLECNAPRKELGLRIQAMASQKNKLAVGTYDFIRVYEIDTNGRANTVSSIPIGSNVIVFDPLGDQFLSSFSHRGKLSGFYQVNLAYAEKRCLLNRGQTISLKDEGDLLQHKSFVPCSSHKKLIEMRNRDARLRVD
jgi:hypothetical protein